MTISEMLLRKLRIPKRAKDGRRLGAGKGNESSPTQHAFIIAYLFCVNEDFHLSRIPFLRESTFSSLSLRNIVIFSRWLDTQYVTFLQGFPGFVLLVPVRDLDGDIGWFCDDWHGDTVRKHEGSDLGWQCLGLFNLFWRRVGPTEKSRTGRETMGLDWKSVSQLNVVPFYSCISLRLSLVNKRRKPKSRWNFEIKWKMHWVK